MADPTLDDRPPPLRRRRHLDIDPVRPHSTRIVAGGRPGSTAAAARRPPRATSPALPGPLEHRRQLVVGRRLRRPHDEQGTVRASPRRPPPIDVHVAGQRQHHLGAIGRRTDRRARLPRPRRQPVRRRPHQPTAPAGSNGTRPPTPASTRPPADRPATGRRRSPDWPAPTRPDHPVAQPAGAACSTHATAAPADACARNPNSAESWPPGDGVPIANTNDDATLPGALHQRRPTPPASPSAPRRPTPSSDSTPATGRRPPATATTRRRSTPTHSPPIRRRLEHPHPPVELRLQSDHRAGSAATTSSAPQTR